MMTPFGTPATIAGSLINSAATVNPPARATVASPLAMLTIAAASMFFSRGVATTVTLCADLAAQLSRCERDYYREESDSAVARTCDICR